MKLHNSLTCITLAVLLNACGGGGGSGTDNTPQAAALSSDQQIFEHEELHGGTYALGVVLPYGGGNLVSGVNYFYSSSTGGFSTSPSTAGSHIEASLYNSLDSALVLPAIAPTRYLLNGKILVRSSTAQRAVSYVGSGVRTDALADDGTTVVQSSLFSNFSETQLSGAMDNAPEELQASYQIDDWVSANNFSANAQWQSGAAYTKRQGALIGDTYFALDCTNHLPAQVTTSSATTPCMLQAKLDSFFPVTLENANFHPYETDFSADGTISMVNGVRMWVANAPLPNAQNTTTTYRIYYELNGNVYMGALEKDGTSYKYPQRDGSVVAYYIGLNQAAVSSVQQGLITGASVPGSQSGSVAEVGTVDLFGIGAHGINGALAPIDLQAHYGSPVSLNGAGQTVALIEAPSTGNVEDDLGIYSQYFNLPQCTTANACYQHIDLSNGAPVPTASDWGAEVELDTQLVHAIAPGAKIVVVTAKSPSQADLFAAINYAAALPGVTAVSMSFAGFPMPSDAQSEDALLSGFQSNKGVAFFASTGDAGFVSWTGAAYPAASPYVTAVGGTRINSVVWNGAPQNEVAWQFSGGGDSYYMSMPAWQSSYLGSSLTALNSGMRAVPDVSAVADSQHSAVSIYYKQRWVMSGGTSASTPIWAGISALFGQYLGNKGSSLAALIKATPGGFNGLLYQAKLMQGTNPAFYDIVSGSNNLGSMQCAICTAVPGYDNVTGLGVPNSSKLFANF
ncbi:Family S53 non-peptidase homologue [Collimonas arenae]|uniref:Family S53 non-peptidase homologue n=1 Tax=Collimonas arenae TaxID=279058 RepID=A0A0A1FGN0_9BURK|nr:S53 family peptidase [Collimonas arenae]AIY42865.1 Family S53 non-peptidase homologue [Collimonas arenae]